MKWLLIFLITYTITGVVIIEYENFRLGYDQLELHHKEYENGGSGKWRIPMFDNNKSKSVSNFPGLLLFWGIPMYILAPIGVIISILHLIRNKKRTNRIFATACLILFIGSFLLYLSQDVWGAVL